MKEIQLIYFALTNENIGLQNRFSGMSGKYVKNKVLISDTTCMKTGHKTLCHFFFQPILLQ